MISDAWPVYNLYFFQTFEPFFIWELSRAWSSLSVIPTASAPCVNRKQHTLAGFTLHGASDPVLNFSSQVAQMGFVTCKRGKGAGISILSGGNQAYLICGNIIVENVDIIVHLPTRV